MKTEKGILQMYGKDLWLFGGQIDDIDWDRDQGYELDESIGFYREGERACVGVANKVTKVDSPDKWMKEGTEAHYHRDYKNDKILIFQLVPGIIFEA